MKKSSSPLFWSHAFRLRTYSQLRPYVYCFLHQSLTHDVRLYVQLVLKSLNMKMYVWLGRNGGGSWERQGITAFCSCQWIDWLIDSRAKNFSTTTTKDRHCTRSGVQFTSQPHNLLHLHHLLTNSQILKHEGSTPLIPKTVIGHNPELLAFSLHRPFSLRTILLFNSLIIRTQSFCTTNTKAHQRI